MAVLACDCSRSWFDDGLRNGDGDGLGEGDGDGEATALVQTKTSASTLQSRMQTTEGTAPPQRLRLGTSASGFICGRSRLALSTTAGL